MLVTYHVKNCVVNCSITYRGWGWWETWVCRTPAEMEK